MAVSAVNPRGYKSAQRLVLFRTQKRGPLDKCVSTNQQAVSSANGHPGSIPSLRSSWTSREGVFAQLSETQDKPRLQPHINLPRSKKPDARRQKSATYTVHRQSSQKYFASLRHMEAELNEIREETQEIEAQIKQAEEEHKGASTSLRSEIDILRDKRKEDESKRNLYRAEAKHLQDQKRIVELERARIESELQAKDDAVQKLQDEIGNWELEENDATKRMRYLDREKRDFEKRVGDAEASLESEIEGLKGEVRDNEHSLQTLEFDSRRVETERNEQIEELKRGPLKDVVDHDRRLESEWQHVQDVLTLRFEAIYAQFIAAEKEFRLASDQLAAVQNELSATIPKKSKNRRRPKKTSKVSSPVNSYPLFGSRFVDDQEHRISLGNIDHVFSDSRPSLKLRNDLPPIPAQLSPTVDRLLPSNLFTTEDLPNSTEMNDLTEPSLVEASDAESPALSTHKSFSLPPRLPPRQISQLANEVTSDTVVEDDINKSPNEATISSLFDGRAIVDETISRRLSTLFSFSRTAKKSEIPIPDKVFSKDSPKPILRHDSAASMGSQDPIGTRPRTYSHSSQQSYTSSLPSRTREVSKQFDAVFDPLSPSGLFGNGHAVATSSPAAKSPRPASIASFDTGSRLPMPSNASAAQFGWPKLEGELPGLGPLANKWQDTPLRQALSLSNSLNSFRSQSRRQVAPAQQKVFSESTSSLVTSNESTENEHDGKLDESAERLGAEESVSTDPSVESANLDRESTRESIFTRGMKGLKLTRKESATTKFNILSSWKKDGGLFGGNKKEKDSKESEDEAGVINENINET